MQAVLGLVDDDDLALIHHVMGLVAGGELGGGGHLQPRQPHLPQPPLTTRQRLDLRPSRRCQRRLAVVPVLGVDVEGAVGPFDVDFLGDLFQAEILVRQLPFRERVGEEVMRVEDLTDCCLGRGASGDLGLDEDLLTAVYDRVHFVDHRPARRHVTGVAQMPDGLAGGHHDRGPARCHRTEPGLLIGSQHVDAVAAEHPPVLGELPMRQSVRGRHQQRRTVPDRLIQRVRHEHQRLALPRQHLYRSPGHLEPALELRRTQHHPTGYLVDRAAPNDLHPRYQRFVFVGVEQPGLQHLIRHVRQLQRLGDVVTRARMEIGQHVLGMIARSRGRRARFVAGRRGRTGIPPRLGIGRCPLGGHTGLGAVLHRGAVLIARWRPPSVGGGRRRVVRSRVLTVVR